MNQEELKVRDLELLLEKIDAGFVGDSVPSEHVP